MVVQMRPEEILNIEYHKVRLLLKALNTKPTKREAAKALKICEKELYNLIAEYKITEVKGIYRNNRKVMITTIEILSATF